MNPVKVTMNPAMFTNHLGIKYAIAGSTWIEIPHSTTFDELSKYMVWDRPVIVPAEESVAKEWKVTGSKGGVYNISFKNKVYTCNCPGYGYRRRCRHIEKIKSDLCGGPMKVGDLIYDWHHGQNGLVVEISENSSYMTVLYEDGLLDRGMRTDDPEVEVINEGR